MGSGGIVHPQGNGPTDAGPAGGAPAAASWDAYVYQAAGAVQETRRAVQMPWTPLPP